MFIDLSNHSRARQCNIFANEFEHVFYYIDNVFNFDCEKTFSCVCVNNIIWVEVYTRMKFFIDEERKYLNNDVDDVVVNEFDYK